MVEAVDTGINDGVSKSIAQLVEKSFIGIIQNSKEGVSFLSSRYAVGFEKYISTTLSRCTNVKTLISTHHPVSLAKAYEPVDLVGPNGFNVDIDRFIAEFGKRSNHAIISATLGAGKSFTMKYIYSLWAKNVAIRRIPIFVELRYIDFQNENIVSYIARQLMPFNNFVTERSVQAGLKNAAFALLLDGFDEIGTRNRAAAEKQILRLSQDFPDTPIVISSRPDVNRFLGWNTFSEYEVAPLSLKKVESMINRIDYDESDKASFVAMIKKGLYKTHEKLLSNPLLASMMLLTFKEFQDIPSKMHVFYGTAFDVLFRKHDTTKAEYHREFATSLDLDDFKRLFMTFCFTSFIEKKHSFDDSSLRRYADKSLNYEDISVKSDDFRVDLLKNICIMHQEGETISFIHRSFQEYFSALFLSKRSIPESYEFIDFIINESGSVSECIQMMIDIDREEFERKYLINRLSQFDRELDESRSDKSKVCALSSVYILGNMSSENEDDQYILVPWTRMRSGAGFRKTNYQFVQQLFNHYGIDPYNVFESGEEGWWKGFSTKFRHRQLSMIEANDIPVAVARRAGLIKYSKYLSTQVKRLLRELNDRHEKKRKLLSHSLRKEKILSS
jgi:hypothetical protein